MLCLEAGYYDFQSANWKGIFEWGSHFKLEFSRGQGWYCHLASGEVERVHEADNIRVIRAKGISFEVGLIVFHQAFADFGCRVWLCFKVPNTSSWTWRRRSAVETWVILRWDGVVDYLVLGSTTVTSQLQILVGCIASEGVSGVVRFNTIPVLSIWVFERVLQVVVFYRAVILLQVYELGHNNSPLIGNPVIYFRLWAAAHHRPRQQHCK